MNTPAARGIELDLYQKSLTLLRDDWPASSAPPATLSVYSLRDDTEWIHSLRYLMHLTGSSELRLPDAHEYGALLVVMLFNALSPVATGEGMSLMQYAYESIAINELPLRDFHSQGTSPVEVAEELFEGYFAAIEQHAAGLHAQIRV